MEAASAVPLRRELRVGIRVQVPLSIQGERRWIILDTGASGTHLDGRRVGLEPVHVRRGVLVRGSGSGGADLRNLEYFETEMMLGDLTLASVQVVGRERRSGLLGLNVLGGLRARYDLTRSLAWFEPVRPRRLPLWSAWRAAYTRAPGTVMSRTAPPPPGPDPEP